MAFESKDIRAKYDEMSSDPVFKNLNVPYHGTPSSFNEFRVNPMVKSSNMSGFREDELSYYRESREKRLAKMYADMKNDPKYNTSLKYAR